MKNEMQGKYVKLGEEQMCNELVGFYDAVAKAIGCEDVESLKYDCRKINVAKNVQDAIISTYKKRHPKTFGDHPQAAMEQVMVILAINGPKVNEELEDNTIEILDGFICPDI